MKFMEHTQQKEENKMTKLDLYTPTDTHSITLDFKTLNGLKEALEYPIYLSPEGGDTIDTFMHHYTMGTEYARSIHNDKVQLYKLEDESILAMNMTDQDCFTLSRTTPSSFIYSRYIKSFKKA